VDMAAAAGYRQLNRIDTTTASREEPAAVPSRPTFSTDIRDLLARTTTDESAALALLALHFSSS